MEVIVVFIAYFFGGIVDSVCGGGGLIMLPSLLAVGVPAHIAVGTNQVSMLPGIVTSVAKFHKNGKIDVKNALYAVPFGIVGGFAGAKLNLLVSEDYLQILLMVLIPVLVAVTFFKPNVGAEDKSKDNGKCKLVVLSATIGFVVGTYHAFYGPASGTFYMLAFAMLLNYDLVTATGNTRFVTMFVSVVSSVTYALSGCVNWMYVLIAAPAYIIGNYLGVSLAITKGAKFVRPMFYVILTLLFIKLVNNFFF